MDDLSSACSVFCRFRAHLCCAGGCSPAELDYRSGVTGLSLCAVDSELGGRVAIHSLLSGRTRS